MVSPEQTQDAWDQFAAGYDAAVTPFSMRVGEDALHRVGLSAGARFLDVAAGGGALSIPAARMGAEVLGVDFSPVMAERLRTHAHDEGLSNLEARVMDGQALELSDDSFDVSGSEFGIMLFPDRQRGIQELVRVTKPGGQAFLVVFGPPPNVELFSLFFGAVRSAMPDFQPPPNSPIFSLQDTDKLRDELTAAGLRDVRVETVTHTLELESAEGLWRMLSSAAPPVGALAASMSDGQKATALGALSDALRQRFGDGPAVLKMQTHLGVGTK